MRRLLKGMEKDFLFKKFSSIEERIADGTDQIFGDLEALPFQVKIAMSIVKLGDLGNYRTFDTCYREKLLELELIDPKLLDFSARMVYQPKYSRYPLSISFVIIRNPERNPLSVIDTGIEAIASYSPCVQVGKWLFVSGQIANKSGSAKEETSQVLDNTKKNLNAAKYDFGDVKRAYILYRSGPDKPIITRLCKSHFLGTTEVVYLEAAEIPGNNRRIEMGSIAYQR